MKMFVSVTLFAASTILLAGCATSDEPQTPAELIAEQENPYAPDVSATQPLLPPPGS